MFPLFLRDFNLAMRNGSGVFVGVLFFLVLITIVPFAMGPNLSLLARIGPAILWIGTLLASLLNMAQLFLVDNDDGSLDLIIISSGRYMLSLLVLSKCVAYWVTMVVPLIIVTPILGIFINMELSVIGATMLSLLVGTPAIVFIGAIGAMLTMGLSRGGVLIPVIVLPLTIPILIFGILSAQGLSLQAGFFSAPFFILVALNLLFAILGPATVAMSVKIFIEES